MLGRRPASAQARFDPRAPGHRSDESGPARRLPRRADGLPPLPRAGPAETQRREGRSVKPLALRRAGVWRPARRRTSPSERPALPRRRASARGAPPAGVGAGAREPRPISAGARARGQGSRRPGAARSRGAARRGYRELLPLGAGGARESGRPRRRARDHRPQAGARCDAGLRGVTRSLLRRLAATPPGPRRRREGSARPRWSTGVGATRGTGPGTPRPCGSWSKLLPARPQGRGRGLGSSKGPAVVGAPGFRRNRGRLVSSLRVGRLWEEKTVHGGTRRSSRRRVLKRTVVYG